MTHDEPIGRCEMATQPRGQLGSGAGLGLAIASAAAFGTSGTFGSALIRSGWSPPTVVLVRLALAAAVLAVPTVLALRGRFGLLRQSAPGVLLYGALAVAGAQVGYFYAIQRLSVGVALMLEYLGIILVVLWMWLVHGRRPRALTVVGAAASVIGLALVLDLFGGFTIDPIGVLWGLGAAVGLATFFVLSARTQDALPPVAMAGTGLGVGAVLLAVLGAIGILPLHAETADTLFAGHPMPWWVPVVGLAVVAAALAYVLGIAAARRLGATVASFVGLTEVLFAVLFAWLFLAQLPTVVQLIGGVFIIGGVALVRVDDLRRDREITLVEPTPVPAGG
jgi:drug/metabolite transporter (DMT)-like permease